MYPQVAAAQPRLGDRVDPLRMRPVWPGFAKPSLDGGESCHEHGKRKKLLSREIEKTKSFSGEGDNPDEGFWKRERDGECPRFPGGDRLCDLRCELCRAPAYLDA